MYPFCSVLTIGGGELVDWGLGSSGGGLGSVVVSLREGREGGREGVEGGREGGGRKGRWEEEWKGRGRE